MCSQVNTFGRILFQERSKKKLSANALSKMSGVNRKTILDIEKGSIPNLITAHKLCNALKIQYIIGRNC